MLSTTFASWPATLRAVLYVVEEPDDQQQQQRRAVSCRRA